MYRRQNFGYAYSVLLSTYIDAFSVFTCGADFFENAAPMDADFFENGEKKLRFKKYPDTVNDRISPRGLVC